MNPFKCFYFRSPVNCALFCFHLVSVPVRRVSVNLGFLSWAYLSYPARISFPNLKILGFVLLGSGCLCVVGFIPSSTYCRNLPLSKEIFICFAPNNMARVCIVCNAHVCHIQNICIYFNMVQCIKPQSLWATRMRSEWNVHCNRYEQVAYVTSKHVPSPSKLKAASSLSFCRDVMET